MASTSACWMPSTMVRSLCRPVIMLARSSRLSNSRLRMVACASLTSTSSAPPSRNPVMAPLTSEVNIARHRCHCSVPGSTSAGQVTPVAPSMSAETRIFMAGYRTRPLCGLDRRVVVLPGFVRWKRKLGADGLLNGHHVRARVDRDDELLAPEQVEHRVGLGVVVAQPSRQGLLGVVFPDDQLAAADVAPVRRLGPVRDQVVVHSAARAEPPGEHPSPHLVVGEVDMDDAVDVIALQEELGLRPVTREAVDDESVVPVVLSQPLADDVLDEVVADQLAGRHRPPDLGPELGVVLDVPAKDVAHAEVDEIEVAGQQPALGALPAALRTHDHVLAHYHTSSHARSVRINLSCPADHDQGRQPVGLHREPDVLHLEVLLDPLAPALTAEAGGLDPAERRS